MTDKNDALFLVRLPFGQKTIPYEEVPELIAMAKSPGYDGEHEAVMLALDVCHEEGPLRAAVQAGEVEVLDKSLHRMTQPFNGRLKDTVLTVQALREYVESIKGFLEVEDAPEPQTLPVLTAGALGGVETDYSLLATREQLLDAFEKWKLKPAWFDELDSHKWLLDARRIKGQGQRGNIVEPMFCPFAVMNGLIESVRKNTRLKPDTAWRVLEHKFPKVYAKHDGYDLRERTGD